MKLNKTQDRVLRSFATFARPYAPAQLRVIQACKALVRFGLLGVHPIPQNGSPQYVITPLGLVTVKLLGREQVRSQ